MDFNRYVGLPFKDGGRGFDGVDCYGLVCIFYANELGIELRSFAEAYESASQQETTARLVSSGLSSWTETAPTPGAVSLIRRGRALSHVGIVAPNRRMLHIEKRDGLSVMAPITDSLSKRIEGYFIPKG